MDMNEKPSEYLAVLATISPSSQAAGAVSSGWVSMANLKALLAKIDVGVFGAAATVDANLQQAQDNTGTGAKAIAGAGLGGNKAITQLLAAGGNNVQCLINLQDHELDANNGFDYVQLTVTVGVAATETAASLIGCSARYEPASAFNAAGVVQVI